MPESAYTVLLADPDVRIRALLAEQLASTGCSVLHASDGATAMQLINDQEIRLVVAEMYLKTGEDDCLIHAIRRSKEFRRTRTLAHTKHATSADREWAMRAGADAYLIKPTRAERFRYVVSRLATTKGANSSVPTTSLSPIVRRDSLERALADVESGALNASAVVFGRTWWEKLPRTEHNAFVKRAKRAGVKLKSDSMLGEHFVEVRRSPYDDSLSTERSEGPYKETH